MKIIDLLNKIANNEDVPKKIKYRDNIWEYVSTIRGTGYQYYSTFFEEWKTLQNQVYLEEHLNDEVEIIDEAKEDKIKKIYHCETSLTQNEVEIFITENLNQMVDKINELIDEINNLKEND